MDDQTKYAVSVYLKISRHLLKQNAKAKVNRSYVLAVQEPRLFDPIGCLLTIDTYNKFGGLWNLSASFHEADVGFALLDSGIDLSNPFLQSVFETLTKIHDDYPVSTWSYRLAYSFSTVFPKVTWKPEMGLYINGHKSFTDDMIPIYVDNPKPFPSTYGSNLNDLLAQVEEDHKDNRKLEDHA